VTGPQRPGGAPPSDPRVLMVIRLAFLLGDLLFAGVTYWTHRKGRTSPGPPPDALIYLPITGIAIAFVTILPLRRALAGVTYGPQRASMLLVGWATGNLAALGGMVYYWFTDDARFALTGVFVLLVTFLIYPIRDRD
jgi:hypothetical protein